MIERMQIRRTRIDTRMITLTASLTALYVIPRTLFLDRLIGLSGSLTWSGVITPVLGVFLAPSYGIFAVLVGTMIAAFIPGSAGTLKFGGLDFLGGAWNIAQKSLLIRGRRTEATLMYVAILSLFVSVVGVGALRFWPAIFLVYPFERAIIALGAVLVCTPLLLASRDLIARYHLQEK